MTNRPHAGASFGATIADAVMLVLSIAQVTTSPATGRVAFG